MAQDRLDGADRRRVGRLDALLFEIMLTPVYYKVNTRPLSSQGLPQPRADRVRVSICHSTAAEIRGKGGDIAMS